MKLSHINSYLATDSNAGLEFIRQSKKLKIINWYNSSSKIVPEPNGIRVYICKGSYKNVQPKVIEKIAIDVKQKFDISLFGNFTDNRKLPEFSDTWFCYIKEKNVLCISLNFFKVLDYLNKDDRIEYVKWVFEKYISKALKGIRLRSKTAIEKEAMTGFLDKIITYNRNEKIQNIMDYEKYNDDYSKAIIENIRKIQKHKQEIIFMKKQLENDKKKFKKEIRDTLALPFVKKIYYDYDEERLVIDVGRINIGKIHIGMFDIYIYPYKIRFKNRTNKKDNYDHPHIDGGRPCFGTGKEKMNELLGYTKIKALVFKSYHFLKQYNEDDANAQIDPWEDMKRLNNDK